jgi:putative endonuclease
VERFSLAQDGGEQGCGLRVGRVEPPYNKGRIMWYVYIIRCADDSLYTGATTDISRRVNEHNRSKGGNYTRVRMPVKLVYQETHADRSEALKREIQIKRWSKEKKLALINGDKTRLTELSRSRD